MTATEYGNQRRERRRRIQSAENAVAIAAVQYVQHVDSVGAENTHTKQLHDALVEATRRYMEAVRS